MKIAAVQSALNYQVCVVLFVVLMLVARPCKAAQFLFNAIALNGQPAHRLRRRSGIFVASKMIVPEPNSCLLLVYGCVGLMAGECRRRR